MKVLIVYKTDNEIKFFAPSNLQEYVDFDKQHKEDRGYVLILKMNNKEDMEKIPLELKEDIDKIIGEMNGK